MVISGIPNAKGLSVPIIFSYRVSNSIFPKNKSFYYFYSKH